jgi:hypothetical protein
MVSQAGRNGIRFETASEGLPEQVLYFSSSMRLLSSSALWWLLLAAIIVFFYLLKLKRKRTVVPSVLLWTRALEEVEANAPFKKLRRSLLLLLQLLALIALVFALAVSPRGYCCSCSSCLLWPVCGSERPHATLL